MGGNNENMSEKARQREDWKDASFSEENNALFEKIGNYLKGELEIEEIKNDHGYAAADNAVKQMLFDYRHNMHNKENEKFIREALSGRNYEMKMKEEEEVKEIREEINRSNLDRISSEWVREWHIKKQGNVEREARKKEIKEFITSSLKQELNFTSQKNGHRRKIRSGRLFFIRYISLAAAVIAGAVIILKVLLPTDDPGRLFNRYYGPIEAISPVTRGLGNNEADIWASAVRNYNDGNYQTASTGFSDLTEMDPSSAAPRFFMGMTHLGLGEYDKAATLLEAVAGEQGEYSKEARWYLGLAYLKAGNITGAAECFENLVQSPGFYSERSEKILRRLK